MKRRKSRTADQRPPTADDARPAVGEVATYSLSSGGTVTGVVRSVVRLEQSQFVRLYLLFDREERCYEFLPGGRLAEADSERIDECEAPNTGAPRENRPLHGSGTTDSSSPADGIRRTDMLGPASATGAAEVEHGTNHTSRTGDDTSQSRTWPARPLIILGGFLLAAIVVPILFLTAGEIEARSLSYDAFLEREYSIRHLAAVVASRLDYSTDLVEYWTDPRSAWNARAGDCEEYALIVAAHLRRHRIEHQVLGLTLRENLQGHAVVLARTQDRYALIDPPTTAVAGGVAFFPLSADPAEFLRQYSHLPVSVYATDAEGANPEVVTMIGNN